MKKDLKVNLPLGIGLLIFSFTQIISRTFGMPEALECFLMGMAVALEIVGIIKKAPAFNRFRQWKRDLIGRSLNL